MQKVHLHGDFALPTAPVSVYFDIEGLPEQEFYYLIGALVVQDGKETHHAFWADGPAEQQSIFLQFSRLVAGGAPRQPVPLCRHHPHAGTGTQSRPGTQTWQPPAEGPRGRARPRPVIS